MLCLALVIGSSVGLHRVFKVFTGRRLDRLLATARKHLASKDFDLVPVTAADARVVDRLERHPAQAQLVALGFKHAGDRREVIGDRREGSVMRFFVSSTGTMVASFSMRVRNPSVQSWTESRAFTTAVGRVGFFALPPSHRYQFVPSSKGSRELVAQHEKWLRFAAAMTAEDLALAQVRTIDEIVERIKAAHLQVANWRNSHDDDDLLQKDLDGLFGAGYDKGVGARLIRALTATPPTARIRTAANKGKSRP